VFDTADTVRLTVRILGAMLRHTTVHAEACARAAADPLLLATDLADYLVRLGMPFRQAHHVVGEVVALAEGAGKPLDALTLTELRSVYPRFGADAPATFDLKRAMERRTMAGAPSGRNLAKQLASWKRRLE
jgi:argininosuccinate lyase